MHSRAAAVMTVGLLMAVGPASAGPMRLDDPRPRWVHVEFEVSPSDAPGRLDSSYTKKALAWFELSSEPGYAQVTVPRRVVEQYLFVRQNPKRGSFSDYVWVFDVATGHVKSARVSGTLIRTLRLGFLNAKLEADFHAEMGTSTKAGYEPPRHLLGQTLFRFCTAEGEAGCTTVAPTPLSADRGYVNAVGQVSAECGMFTTNAFSPIGEAIFSEVEPEPLTPLPLSESAALGPADERF